MERNSTIAAWRLYGFIEQTIAPTFSPEYRRWLMELAGVTSKRRDHRSKSRWLGNPYQTKLLEFGIMRFNSFNLSRRTTTQSMTPRASRVRSSESKKLRNCSKILLGRHWASIWIGSFASQSLGRRKKQRCCITKESGGNHTGQRRPPIF